MRRCKVRTPARAERPSMPSLRTMPHILQCRVFKRKHAAAEGPNMAPSETIPHVPQFKRLERKLVGVGQSQSPFTVRRPEHAFISYKSTHFPMYRIERKLYVRSKPKQGSVQDNSNFLQRKGLERNLSSKGQGPSPFEGHNPEHVSISLQMSK